MSTKLANTNLAAEAFTWTPSAEQLDAANIVRLARTLGCDDYPSLHRVSIEEPDRFWRAVRDDLELPFARDWDRVLDDSRGVEWTTWFEGARLNLADVCVHRWARERGAEEAVVWQSEDDQRTSLSWRELSREIVRLAEGLASLGVGRGRRRRHLPADVTRGRDRLARMRAPRRRTGADLLRVRRAGDRHPARATPTPRS